MSVKERPILFLGEMVRAILDGRKTQTRRPVKPQPMNGWEIENPPTVGRITSAHPKKGKWGVFIKREHMSGYPCYDLIPSPFGFTGDKLYVREQARLIETLEGGDCGIVTGLKGNDRARFRYEADGQESGWLPYPDRLAALQVGESVANGCYREAARLILEVVNIRVERVQEISEADAREEGVGVISCHHPEWDGDPDEYRKLFRLLWDSLYGEGAFAANGWVWVGEFKKLEGDL